MSIICPVCRGLSIGDATTFCNFCDNTGMMVALSPKQDLLQWMRNQYSTQTSAPENEKRDA